LKAAIQYCNKTRPPFNYSLLYCILRFIIVYRIEKKLIVIDLFPPKYRRFYPNDKVGGSNSFLNELSRMNKKKEPLELVKQVINLDLKTVILKVST